MVIQPANSSFKAQPINSLKGVTVSSIRCCHFDLAGHSFPLHLKQHSREWGTHNKIVSSSLPQSLSGTHNPPPSPKFYSVALKPPSAQRALKFEGLPSPHGFRANPRIAARGGERKASGLWMAACEGAQGRQCQSVKLISLQRPAWRKRPCQARQWMRAPPGGSWSAAVHGKLSETPAPTCEQREVGEALHSTQ